jgi:hypothetical protein
MPEVSARARSIRAALLTDDGFSLTDPPATASPRRSGRADDRDPLAAVVTDSGARQEGQAAVPAGIGRPRLAA